MTDREALSAGRLQSEARGFEMLLKRYLGDREFLTAQPTHQLLYFLDAHELKSFIDPQRLRRPDDGFALAAERARPQPTPDRFWLDTKLKNDQLISDFVLGRDPPQVGLLPSYEEELQEELNFQNGLTVSTQIGLLRQAAEQVRNLPPDERLRKYQAVANAPNLTPELRQSLLEFIRGAAPALLALIQRNPDDSRARMDRLLDHSALCLPQDIDWAKLGYQPHASAALQAFVPDADLLQRWRRYLVARRPKGSYRANRIDADAIGWLQGLNDLLRSFDAPGTSAPAMPSVRAILVTRSWALSILASDPISTTRFGLKPAEFLRHPRLAVLNSSTAALQRGNAATDEPERVLAVALDTYRRQLELASDDDASGEDWSRAAIDPLVGALHGFEESRFAIGLRNHDVSHEDDRVTDQQIREVLACFRTDGQIVGALKEGLFASVQQFSEAIVRLRRGRGARIEAHRQCQDGSPPRSRVMPLVMPTLGPVDFPSENALPADRTIVLLEKVVREVTDGRFGREGWNYVAWALLLACEGNIRAAEIYASGAIHLAQLLQRDGGPLKHEATLLLDQIRRLRLRLRPLADEAQSPAATHENRRWRNALHLANETLLTSSRSDARHFLERAALRLELALVGEDRQAVDGWRSFCHEIESASKRCRHDPALDACVLAHGVAGILARHTRLSQREGWRESGESATPDWHRRLRARMEELAGTAGGRAALPLLARVMELVGFQMFAGLPGDGAAAQPSRPATLQIPAGLRLEVASIEERRQEATSAAGSSTPERPDDHITSLALEALGRIAVGLQHHMQRDLIYAPIWTSYADERIVALISDQTARDAARNAYDRLARVAGASQQFGVFERDRGDLEKIASLLATALEGVERRVQDGDPDAERATYFLRMEKCYARLLTILLTVDGRASLVEDLCGDYRDIALQFPASSIPHFRLSILYGELGRHEETARELAASCELVDSDPFEIGPDHWVRSTMLRRRVVADVKALRPDRDAALGGDKSARGRYSAGLAKALRELRSSYRLPGPDADFLTSLEGQRRLNNIVFYGGLLLQADRSGSELARAGLDRKDLIALVDALNPKGVEAVLQPTIVHTLGLAYYVLDDKPRTRRASEHLRRLVLTAESTDLEQDREMLRDAESWVSDRSWDLLPDLPAAAKGFSEPASQGFG